MIPEPMKIERFTDHRYIQEVLLDQVKYHMAKGAAHYGEDNHRELGLKGQFADIWRKVQPLKRYMWEGKPLASAKESPREILMDLIGHCLLTIAMIDQDDRTGTPVMVLPDVSIDDLKSKGWVEDPGKPGYYMPPVVPMPKEAKRGPEFRRVSVITDLEGTRRCSYCSIKMTMDQANSGMCNCVPE